MTTNDPFGPGRRRNDPLERHREQADALKRALGPTYELQQQIKSLQNPLANLGGLERAGALDLVRTLERTGALSTIRAAANLPLGVKAMEAIATPSWMLSLQKTAAALSRDHLGVLKTQELLARSTIPDVVKLSETIDTNRSTIARLMAASDWTARFRSLNERIAPSLEGIRLAAERAAMLDMATLRASADELAKSSILVAAEQVLEAHRLIEAIGQSESAEQSAGLFTALISLMAALFSRLGENTMKELREIGAIRLIEVFMLVVAILHFAAPDEVSPAEGQVVAEIQGEVDTLVDKLGRILSANESANEAYVADLPRAELKRDAVIRREPRRGAPPVMRGQRGILLAVKASQNRWRLVVFRDPLTSQLAEGWVYAPAVELLAQGRELSRPDAS